MNFPKPSTAFVLAASIVALSDCSSPRPSDVPLTQGQVHILYETNSGYQDLSSTATATFATYKLPASLLAGDFFEYRRMITEEFMAGVNFAQDTATLILEQYWNGTKVQQCVVTPKLVGAPPFGAGQNRPLDIRTQIRREAGSLSGCTLRNHTYWRTDFNGTTFFGQGDEFAWGNIAVDLSKEVEVEWKYRWSTEGNHFYFDHLKVLY